MIGISHFPSSNVKSFALLAKYRGVVYLVKGLDVPIGHTPDETWLTGRNFGEPYFSGLRLLAVIELLVLR